MEITYHAIANPANIQAIFLLRLCFELLNFYLSVSKKANQQSC